MKTLIVDDYVIEEPIKNILYKLKEETCGYKLKAIVEKSNEFVVTCPNKEHSEGQEKVPDCHINTSDSSDVPYGTFNCFACGVHGSFIYFVALCLDSSLDFAKSWLIKNYGIKNNNLSIDLEPIKLSDIYNKTKVEYLDESILNTFQSYHPYMDKRKLNRKVCSDFKIKYDPKSECLVFPVWDEYGRLVMLTRRSVNNKNFYIDKDKEKPVYLLNNIIANKINTVIVTESQINCLTCYSYDLPSVALFGTGTSHQYELLNKSEIKHYYLCFDGDDAGDKGIKKFLKNIRKDVFVDVILMTRGKDVNDLTQEEFDKLPIIDKSEWLRRNN